MKKKYDIFLKKNGISNTKLQLIEGDASTRKYYRIDYKSKLLLMDSQSEVNNNERFVCISNYLNKINLSSPKIIDYDQQNGLLLIEDLGNYTFNKALEDNIPEIMLYKKAIDSLILLHKNKVPGNVPYYDVNILMKEVNLFIEWYCPNLGLQLSKESIDNWNKIWINYLNPITKNNNILVLRDFHADNLFWLPERIKEKQLGIIDFQDALIGHIAYDISSLLNDVRRNIKKNTKKTVLDYFIRNSNLTDKNKFEKNYNILTAQRNAKIAGIFVRLAKRDKKTRYLEMLGQAIKIFKNAAQEAELLEILNWLKQHSI